MKLSTKVILPIILISALLILLTGCFGVPDDSPAYTLGSIQGTMARPEECCYDPEAELADDPISPNICDVDWYAWANVKVVLTTWVDSVEIELATTVTDENGAYLFDDVPPAKNYIITAICPTDEGFVIKDVAEEVVGGETYDAGIADAESTVLALCLEGLGEIGSDSYLLDLDDFQSHSDYNKVIEEVCDYLANCEHAIPSWVNVLTGLSPGFTEDTEEGVFIGGTGGGYVPTTVYYDLTVTIVGNGSVKVDGNIYTGPVTVNEGTSLALEALADEGWDFDGWSGDASASPVTMDANKTVTATFSLIPPTQYTLTINYVYEGGGQAAPSYVDAAMNVGDLYSEDSPLIAGYTADRLNVSGTMPVTDVTETVTYTANAPNTGCLLVKVYNPNGNGYGAGWVKLYDNSTTYGPYNTEGNGWYTFTNIPVGIYNLTADGPAPSAWIRPSSTVTIVIGGTVCQEENLQYTTAE